MRRWLPLALLLLVPAAAGADFKDLDESFRARIADPAVGVLARKTVAGEVGQVGTAEAVRTLLGGVAAVDDRLAEDDKLRARYAQEYAPLNSDKLLDAQWKRKEELDRLMAAVDARIRDHEAVLEILFRELCGQTAEAARGELVSSASQRASSWRARAYAASAAAGIAALPAVVPLRMLRDSDPRVRGVVAEGFGRRKDPETVPDLGAALLKEDAWQVRVSLVRALEEIGSIKATRFLIEALGKESGRLLEDINDALRKLTGQNFQPEVGEWKRWYEEHKEEIEGGEDTKGPKGPSGRKKPEGSSFYGLQTYSARLVYIIDCSGSMEDPLGVPGAITQEEGAEEAFSGPKIELAKRELKRTIRSLGKESFFNIVAFNHIVRTWQEKMMPATQANKNEAYVWVRKLEPEGSTYLYGALQKAFEMAGMGANDPGYAPAVDTIVLLSDGAPTDNNPQTSTRMDPEVILQAVRGWNKLAKIKVHVIAIDEAKSIRFLQDLAKENGGSYIAK